MLGFSFHRQYPKNESECVNVNLQLTGDCSVLGPALKKQRSRLTFSVSQLAPRR